MGDKRGDSVVSNLVRVLLKASEVTPSSRERGRLGLKNMSRCRTSTWESSLYRYSFVVTSVRDQKGDNVVSYLVEGSPRSNNNNTQE